MSGDYDSNFDTETDDTSDDKRKNKRRERTWSEDRVETIAKRQKASKSQFVDETDKNERKLRTNFQSLDAYTRHKLLVNEYILNHPGSTAKLVRNTSKDKTEYEVLRDNHRFIWEESEGESDLSWGQRLAKKYYKQLFKEYCISDLSRYKDNKFGMRWRTEKEVLEGKGQFSCGSKHCDNREELKSWEVLFAYEELGQKKSALVKLRLCEECSLKLNYRQKRREIKRHKKSNKLSKKEFQKVVENPNEPEVSGTETISEVNESATTSTQIWSKPQPILDLEKPIDEEFDQYLEDLLV